MNTDLEITKAAMTKILTIGRGIALAQRHPALPSFPSTQELATRGHATHVGFGMFEGGVEAGEFDFDAGGAMQRCYIDGHHVFSWTAVRTHGNAEVLAQLGIDPAQQAFEVDALTVELLDAFK